MEGGTSAKLELGTKGKSNVRAYKQEFLVKQYAGALLYFSTESHCTVLLHTQYRGSCCRLLLTHRTAERRAAVYARAPVRADAHRPRGKRPR